MKRQRATGGGAKTCHGSGGWFCFVLFGIVWLALVSCSPRSGEGADFGRLSREGKKYFDAGDWAKAITALEKAVALAPSNLEARLNLANACLAGGRVQAALQQATEAVRLDHNSAAGHFLAGCAQLRLGQAEEAVKALHLAKNIDQTVNAVAYQLGRAHQQLGKFEAAIAEFEELVQFEPEHPAAHYNLSQVYMRVGKSEEAARQLAEHQRVTAGKAGQVTDPAQFERCRYTKILVPFLLAQPDRNGLAVKFAEATAALFGPGAASYHEPLAVLDVAHDGRYSVLVGTGEGFQLLVRSNGMFAPSGAVLLAVPGAHYRKALVGDLNNDQVDDVVVLGDKGSQVFKFATNQIATDISRFARLADVAASNGILADLEYTSKLDLLLVGPGTNGFLALRNLGHPYFVDCSTNFHAADLAGAHQFLVEDWNQDDLLDLLVVRVESAPVVLARQRGGGLVATNLFADAPHGGVVAAGDIDCDLRPDLVIASGSELVCLYSSKAPSLRLPLAGGAVAQLGLVDYDNDGWLDILAVGQGLHLWRNLGRAGFVETTKAVGLEGAVPGEVAAVVTADLDGDCDTDALLAVEGGGLRFLRNDGGNANHQLKIHLAGTKSNASGLGMRLEVTAEGLHLSRRVSELPIEIGVGKNAQVDALTVQWFDFTQSTVDIRADPCSVLSLQEFQMQTGSCPYLYAWDGRGFRFVTDILGASPAGLPLSESRLVEADPDEYVWVGDATSFPPRGGHFALQVTEELREVLYLDEAKLVVVDHPESTEVHTTEKMVPGKPFPPSQVITLARPKPLRRALDDEGADVADVLAKADGRLVSPGRLRSAQLMGLAQPFGVVLDFGPLEVERPLVLAITAWLRFGGATVNIAASHDPDLPYPFPTLEVEVAGRGWRPVDVVVGMPAGKTKNFVVDLSGKLPPGSGRLRLRTGFELHWDRIGLLEKHESPETKISRLTPVRTDLHWRGFSRYESWPRCLPLTPNYAAVRSSPLWRMTPEGWCTRYGEVGELVETRDDALVLLNGGDELTLEFDAAALSPKPDGWRRDFFLYAVGWDKDADIHCVAGSRVEPLPWHGMDDQRYGQQARPSLPSDGWIQKYNTRWVGPRTLAQRTERRHHD